VTVTTQIDPELHKLLTDHCAARRCSKSQVIKDQLVALLVPATTPRKAIPTTEPAWLPELRHRPAPKVLTVAEAKRQAKGGRP
jgi:hypothetical protein